MMDEKKLNTLLHRDPNGEGGFEHIAPTEVEDINSGDFFLTLFNKRFALLFLPQNTSSFKMMAVGNYPEHFFQLADFLSRLQHYYQNQEKLATNEKLPLIAFFFSSHRYALSEPFEDKALLQKIFQIAYPESPAFTKLHTDILHADRPLALTTAYPVDVQQLLQKFFHTKEKTPFQYLMIDLSVNYIRSKPSNEEHLILFFYNDYLYAIAFQEGRLSFFNDFEVTACNDLIYYIQLLKNRDFNTFDFTIVENKAFSLVFENEPGKLNMLKDLRKEKGEAFADGYHFKTKSIETAAKNFLL